MMRKANPIRLFFIVLGTAFIVRMFFFALILFQEPRKFNLVDIDGYVWISKTLLATGQYSRGQVTNYAADLGRTPVYPFFLAFLSWLFQGRGAWTIFIQMLVGCGSVGLAYLLARELRLPQPAPALAAFLFAFDPISILLAHYPLTETLFTLLLLAALTLFARYLHAPSRPVLVFSAVFFALAALTRPIAQFLPFIFVPVVFLFLKQRGWRTNLQDTLVWLGIFIALLLPWIIRNGLLGGPYSLSSVGDINIYYYGKTVLANVDHISQEEALARLDADVEAHAQEGHWIEAQRLGYQRKLGIAIMVQHPLETVKMAVSGLARLLLDPGYTLVCTALDIRNFTDECFPGQATMLSGGIAQKMVSGFLQMNFLQKAVLAWAVLWMLVLYALSAIGIWRLFQMRQLLAGSFLLATAAYYIILSTGAVALYRLRAPVIPLLAVLSACAGPWNSWLKRLSFFSPCGKL